MSDKRKLLPLPIIGIMVFFFVRSYGPPDTVPHRHEVFAYPVIPHEIVAELSDEELREIQDYRDQIRTAVSRRHYARAQRLKAELQARFPGVK